MLDEDISQAKENFTFLPTKEMYLYFPQKDDICKKITDPKLKILRNFFHVKQFHIEEEKKYEILKKSLKEYIDITIKPSGLNNLEKLNTIMNNKEDMMRYLNYNNYDIHQTLNMLKNMSNLLKKYNISSEVKFSEKIAIILNYGFIYCLGRDKKYRPIIVVDFRKYDTRLVKQIEIKDIVEIFIYYLNFVIDQMMLRGQIEQFNVIIQIDGMDSSNFLNNFKDIIHLIQMYFPSRLHLMYIVTFKNTLETSYSLIENFMLLYNKERTIMINKKKYNALLKEISQETLTEFLESLGRSNNSIYSSGSNGSDPNKNTSANKTKPKNMVLFPPLLNNDIIFDLEEEKTMILMNVDDYLKFIKENENRDFYCFDEKLFNKNSSRGMVNICNSKEFSLDNFVTFSQKLISFREANDTNREKEQETIKKDSESIRLKNIELSIPKEEHLTQEKSKTNNDLTPENMSHIESRKDDIIRENLTEGMTIIKPSKNYNSRNRYNNGSLSDRKDTERKGSMRLNSWKKNLSIKINANMDSTQNSVIKFVPNQFDILSTSQKKDLNNCNLVFDSQGRGDACCKITKNCLIF